MNTKRKALLVLLLVVVVFTLSAMSCDGDLNIVKTGGEIVREIAPQVHEGYDAGNATFEQLITHGLP
jgi:hypothetical protein